MKKAVILNSVAVNAGDALLACVLYRSLENSGYSVIVETDRLNDVRKLYPNIQTTRVDYELPKWLRRIFRLLPFVRLYYLKRKVRTNDAYRDANLFVAAPGGYINSYYGFEDKLFCMRYLKELYPNTKLVMYSQSVGPLDEKDKAVLEKYIGVFDMFAVRDEYSYQFVKQFPNTLLTNDAGFLLGCCVNRNNGESNVIGISVRSWNKDDRDKNKYIALMKALIETCISFGKKVEMISTCQGIKNYIDDSEIAEEIVETLSENCKGRIIVNHGAHNFYELREIVKKYDFVIGTRLHMCILSIQTGIPALNISYEAKGKECYRYMGLEEFTIDYNENIDNAVNTLQKFILRQNELRTIYDMAADKACKEAEKHFMHILHSLC